MSRVVVVDCPRCEARVKAEIMRTEDAIQSETRTPEYRVSLARCPGCHEPLLTREECVEVVGPNEWGDEPYRYGPPSRVWPLPEREASRAVPAIVQVSLDEAYKCHRSGAHTACAVM